jgi:hypothetical protein
MQDSRGFIIWLLSVIVKKLVHLIAWILSVIQAIKDKKLGDYFYSLGIGNDIYGNKLIAPHANKYWVKKGGHEFGSSETISRTMAKNKRDGFNTKHADRWEEIINVVDRNHLAKVASKIDSIE